MEIKYTQLGKNLRELRLRRKWTQLELSQKASMSRIAIIHIESGKAKPTLETLSQLSKALGTTLFEIFQGALAGSVPQKDDEKSKAIHYIASRLKDLDIADIARIRLHMDSLAKSPLKLVGGAG